MLKYVDSLIGGVLLALSGLIISFFGFAWYWSIKNNTTISYYIEEIFFGTTIFQDSILTISVLFDVVLFAILYQLQLYKACKGILAIVLIAVGVILYLY